jgi:integrase
MEEEINKGFDRSIDYEKMKGKLIRALRRIYHNWKHKDHSPNENSKLLNKMIYLIIAIIQLRNGSRISEACKAFKKFVEKGNHREKVIIKISKSDGLKYNNKTKKKDLHKARFRKMIYPDWIRNDITEIVLHADHTKRWIQSDRLEKRVLDYLLKNFSCNTHSLRYACINYLLNDQEIPMPTVAKFVGHINVNQLVTYTQNKNVDKIFDLDI